jgi:hypothetical protein|tara:strand:+ start:4202 stop:4432 length:231 start_codon:yes stop_codon:yes gene_type:complete
MSLELEKQLLEERKVKALEKIGDTLDALTIWFEEIDKDEWSNRLQFYLGEFHKIVPKEVDETETQTGSDSSIQEQT